MSTSSVPVVNELKGAAASSAAHVCLPKFNKACSLGVCDFNGGCGEAFHKATDLLDHITSHLEEASIIKEIHQEGDEDFPYGLRGLNRGSKPLISPSGRGSFKDSFQQSASTSDSLNSSPANGLDVGMGTMQLFPELNYMLHRQQSDSSLDTEMSGPYVRMEEILSESAGEDSNSSSEDAWLENINWSEILQNASSAADLLESEDWILDLPDDLEDAWVQDENNPTVSKDTRKVTEVGADVNFKTMPNGGKNLKLLHRSASCEMGCQRPRGLHILKESNHLNILKDKSASNEEERIQDSENIERPSYKHRGFKKTHKRTGRRSNAHSNVEYYSAEFILQEGLQKRRVNHPTNKPYVCPVPDCGKAYKNPNGIKYHARYGHSAPQEFPCYCGKIYSTRHGLMAHRRAHSSVYNSPASTGEYLSFSETEESDES